MKYLMIAVVTAGIALGTAPAFASPCYGTSLPGKFKFLLGAEYNFVINRDLENGHGRVQNPDYFMTLSAGLTDWLSIDLKGGAGKITWKDSPWGDQDFSTSFAGAYGFRVRLLEIMDKKLKVVTGFQHISVHPRRVITEDGKVTVIVDEWQGSVLASYSIQKFTPYIGCKYGTYDVIRFIDGENRKRFKSDDGAGIVVGMDFWVNERVKVNAEGHFLDEQAASVSCGVLF